MKQVQVPVVKQVEQIIEVPQIQTVQRFVDVPVVKQVEQIIEVPKIQTVEKVVEVPQVQLVPEYQEVVQVQTIQKVVDKPFTTIQEQIIEVPRVEYQDVEGTVTTEAVAAPTVRQAQMGTTRQERVVGPDLDPVIMQQAPQPTASYVAPVTQTG